MRSTNRDTGRQGRARAVRICAVLAVALGLILRTHAPAAGARGDQGPGDVPAQAARTVRAEADGELAQPVDSLAAARAAYTDTLRRAARTDAADASAAEAAADLQRAAFADGQLRALADLHRFQLATAAAIGGRDPQCYRPVVWLHYRVASCLDRPEDQILRTPALELVAEMASAMYRRGGPPENRRFATDAMLCAAYTVLEEGNRPRASDLFDRLIRLDRTLPEALLGVGAIDERYGRFDAAVKQLRQLVEVDPANGEGRLRLAVNLVRLDRWEEAEGLLRELAEDTAQRWIRSLAVQELARGLVARGDLEGAREVLRRGLLELPGDQRLRVQSAFVLDRMGHVRAAAELLEGVGGDGPAPGAGARWRYSRWPSFDVAAHEARLADLASAAAPTLAVALGAEGAS